MKNINTTITALLGNLTGTKRLIAIIVIGAFALGCAYIFYVKKPSDIKPDTAGKSINLTTGSVNSTGSSSSSASTGAINITQ